MLHTLLEPRDAECFVRGVGLAALQSSHVWVLLGSPVTGEPDESVAPVAVVVDVAVERLEVDALVAVGVAAPVAVVSLDGVNEEGAICSMRSSD